MPTTLFSRLALLLVGVLVLSTAISVLVFRIGTNRAAIENTARTLIAQTLAADALFEGERAKLAARMRDLGLQQSAQPARAPPVRLLFLQQVETRLAELLPDRAVQIVGMPTPAAWISAKSPEDGWIVIPLAPLRASIAVSTFVAALAALLIVLGAAAWYARRLVRPLQALVIAAPGIAAGAPVAPPRGAAAEVDALAQALNRAAGAVAEAARERELMLAGVSHDMRTPLARLGIALELLGGDREIRDGMAADLAELDAIVGQFIAYAREGRDEASAETDLAQLLAEAVAAQQRAGRSWQVVAPAALILSVKPMALRRALDNLLENAARHGAAPFEVELKATPDGTVICVRDRGPGVAPAILADLGKPFFRADPARSGRGSGLGLAVVVRIAALHGGNLTLRNREAGGFEAELVFRTPT